MKNKDNLANIGRIYAYYYILLLKNLIIKTFQLSTNKKKIHAVCAYTLLIVRLHFVYRNYRR